MRRSIGFLGHHHTEETKVRLSKALKGKPKPEGFGANGSKVRMGHIVTQETRDKISKSRVGRFSGENHPMFGRHHTKESIAKIRESRLGSKNWIYGKHHSDKTIIRMREVSMGHEVSEETREKLRQFNLGHLASEETKAKLSKFFKNLWQNPTYATKTVQAILRGNNIRPNKQELLLQSILNENFPDEWKYVGDGQLIIGRKCPDFTNINGKKELIEYYGNYWHNGEDPTDRINLFARYGYRTLIIWENELKNENLLVNKISSFTGKEGRNV